MSRPLAALSSVAGSRVSRHGAGAVWNPEVLGDGWVPQLLDFSLKKEMWLHRGGLSPGDHFRKSYWEYLRKQVMEFDRKIGLCTRAWSVASRRDEDGERCPQWFMRWTRSDLSSLNINVSFLSESKLFWRLGGQLIGLKRTETDRSSLFSSRAGLERTQLRRRLPAVCPGGGAG